MPDTDPHVPAAWAVIVSRMPGGESVRGLARMLVELRGAKPTYQEIERERRKVAKWKTGAIPNPESANQLAALLGGLPEDYRPSREALLQARVDELERALARAEQALARRDADVAPGRRRGG